jgi:hypothetical protein
MRKTGALALGFQTGAAKIKPFINIKMAKALGTISWCQPL